MTDRTEWCVEEDDELPGFWMVVEPQKEGWGLIIARYLDKPTALKIAAVNEMEAALDDICTQYPLVHFAPVPAWIRNGRAALAKARGESDE